MTLEIIITGILTVSVPIAGVMAIHNITELSKLREQNNKTEVDNIALSEQVEFLEYRNSELENELKVEKVNAKLLERALLDAVANAEGANSSDTTENDKVIAEDEKSKTDPSPFVSMERLPNLPTNFYPAEYMTTITDTTSQQYKLNQKCHTESGTGLRYYYDGAEEYYTAAMGGAYGDTIGDAWRVTLECGSVFNVMRGDYKHALPAEPDDFGDLCRNYDKQLCMCVLEFITDKAAMPQYLKDAGGFHKLDFFGGLNGDGGNIVKIEYLGRRWEP